MINHLNKTDTADKFIGGTLVATNPVNVYSSPDSTTLIRVVKKGGTVGTIYSWTTKNGAVWWQLEDGRFVKHETGLYNFEILSASLAALSAAKQAEIDKRVEERKRNNNNFLYNLFTGGSMNTIIIIIVLLIILMLVKK